MKVVNGFSWSNRLASLSFRKMPTACPSHNSHSLSQSLFPKKTGTQWHQHATETVAHMLFHKQPCTTVSSTSALCGPLILSQGILKKRKWAFMSQNLILSVPLLHLGHSCVRQQICQICQQIWKTQQWPQDWKRSVFIPIPKKGNAKAPVFLPGESQGWGSLVGCCLWGRTETDTTEAT